MWPEVLEEVSTPVMYIDKYTINMQVSIIIICGKHMNNVQLNICYIQVSMGSNSYDAGSLQYYSESLASEWLETSESSWPSSSSVRHAANSVS